MAPLEIANTHSKTTATTTTLMHTQPTRMRMGISRSGDLEEAEKWIKYSKNNLRLMHVPEHDLPSSLETRIDNGKGVQPGTILQHYFPNTLKCRKMTEFHSLVQTSGMSVIEYTNQFNAMGAPSIMADDAMKMVWFEENRTGNPEREIHC
ncbi:sucrose synthase 1 [Striga asiatica]|uniref:Sucrose synthase 1 n=1 Tax=Striga asiatica TaxID=4170 RepID=A0A5A7QB30_STRAF|nr:sucrose synthase 1 [Striga asiatica]